MLDDDQTGIGCSVLAGVCKETGGLPAYTVGAGAGSAPPPTLIGVHQAVGLIMNRNDKVQALTDYTITAYHKK